MIIDEHGRIVSLADKVKMGEGRVKDGGIEGLGFVRSDATVGTVVGKRVTGKGIVVSGSVIVGGKLKEQSLGPSRLPKSDQTIQKIIDKASRILGDKDGAMRWLGTPVRALDYATPISLLGSKDGVIRVNNVLGQMENGIW